MFKTKNKIYHSQSNCTEPFQTFFEQSTFFNSTEYRMDTGPNVTNILNSLKFIPPLLHTYYNNRVVSYKKTTWWVDMKAFIHKILNPFISK